jgi:hypothetical protein
VNAGDTARWGDTEHLLAIVADRLEVANFLFQSANSKGNKKPDKPKPLPRPGDKPVESRRTQLTDREIARRLVQMHRTEVTRGRS